MLTVLGSFATSVARGVLGARLTPHRPRHTGSAWMTQNGADLWRQPGFLRVTREMLQQDYGHHHPDFHHDAVEAISRSPSLPDQNQGREQNAINGFERNQTTLNFQEEQWSTSFGRRGGRRFKSCHSDQHLAGSDSLIPNVSPNFSYCCVRREHQSPLVLR